MQLYCWIALKMGLVTPANYLGGPVKYKWWVLRMRVCVGCVGGISIVNGLKLYLQMKVAQVPIISEYLPIEEFMEIRGKTSIAERIMKIKSDFEESPEKLRGLAISWIHGKSLILKCNKNIIISDSQQKQDNLPNRGFWRPSRHESKIKRKWKER